MTRPNKEEEKGPHLILFNESKNTREGDFEEKTWKIYLCLYLCLYLAELHHVCDRLSLCLRHIAARSQSHPSLSLPLAVICQS